MARICVQAPVGHDPATTTAMLEAYMNGRRRSDGSVALALRVNLRPGRTDDLSLSHDVLVRFQRARDDENLNDIFRVAWEPAGEGPFPHFSGVMNVYAEPDPRASRLELDGSYEPPLGAAGKAFDAAIGAKMARASLQDLIDRIAAELTPVASSETRR